MNKVFGVDQVAMGIDRTERDGYERRMAQT